MSPVHPAVNGYPPLFIHPAVNGYLALFRAGEGERQQGRGMAPNLGYMVAWYLTATSPMAIRAMGQPFTFVNFVSALN